MRDATIARNYAEALFAIAQKAGDLPGWGRMINEIGAAVDSDRTLRIFLESPKIPAEKKKALFTRSYQDRAPRLFVRFLHALVNNGRQNLLPEVAQEYLAMVDEAEGRMHATVTVASEPDEAMRGVVKQQLSRAFGVLESLYMAGEGAGSFLASLIIVAIVAAVTALGAGTADMWATIRNSV